MKATFENDPTRGPGYGFMRLNDMDLTNILESAPLFSLCRSSDGLFMTVNGWQEAEERLKPDSFRLDAGALLLSVSPPVVDKLDMQQIHRLTLYCGTTSQRCTLNVQQICYSPLANGGAVAAPIVPAAPIPPVAPPAPVEEPKPPVEEPAPQIPLDMPQTTPQKSSSGLIVAGVVLCLALGGGVWWYLHSQQTAQPTAAQTAQTTPAPAAQTPPPAQAEPAKSDKPEAPKAVSDNATQPASVKEPAPAPTPPAPQATTEPAKTPQRSAKEQVHTFLRNPGTPAEALALGKQIPLATADDQDALFLLLESAAEGGNAEAMLGVARFYNPADASPSGTIIKDAEQAFIWLNKAKAVPETAADAAKALTALRDWLQPRAASDASAKALLDRMEK